MFEVFNKGALTRNQRFVRALVSGIIVTIVLAVAYGLVAQLLDFEFSVVFVGIGYLIGTTIQKMGRGVQIQFSILGAVLAFLCFFFADIISWFGFSVFSSFGYLGFAAKYWFQVFFSFSSIDPWLVLSLMFRGLGVYSAYQNSRVV